MQPSSAIINKKKSANKQVSEAQSKDVMNDLLNELDDQDDENLQEVQAKMQAAATGQVAFNQEDMLEKKYAMTLGGDQESQKSSVHQKPSQESKKRPIQEVEAPKPVASKPKVNPFRKNGNEQSMSSTKFYDAESEPALEVKTNSNLAEI